jgi:parvulin-like peptidyl-prolyl isomerase
VREKKQNKLIIIGFIVTAALIIGMVGYALLYDTVFKNYIPVAKVDSKKIDNEYFVERVRLERNAYIQQYNMMYAQYQMFAGTEEYADYADYYVGQLQQVQSVLDDYESFGELVLDNMVNDQVIAIEAEKLGVVVTDEEVDNLVRELFDYYPEGTPTPEPTSTPYIAPPVTDEQQALLGYTATPDDTAAAEEAAVEDEAEAVEAEEAVAEDEVVGEDAETEEEAAAVEDEAAEAEAEEVVEPTATAAPESTATALPTETPYTQELYEENFANYLADLEEINVHEEYLRQYIYYYLLTQKVQEKIVNDIPVEQEQVWARHILVETKAEADNAIARLNAGEDWNDLADELSLDTSNSSTGGDLGWFARGYMVAPFEEAAFALPVGEVSDPVETDYGWHIVQVIAHETRPMSADDYDYAQQSAYDEWLTEAKETKNIKINEVWKDLVPDNPQISTEMMVN